MKFPTTNNWRNTMHGLLHSGGYVYQYTDDTGMASITVRVEKRGAPEVFAHRHAALPQQTFDTDAEMRAALDAVTDEQFAAELATWPRITESRRVDGPIYNRCRFCQEDGVYRLHVHRHWCSGVGMPLCSTHAVGTAAELLAKFDALIAARRPVKPL